MPKRRLEDLPEKTQEKIRLMVADLVLLWGIIPGKDPERRRAYQKVWDRVEKEIRRYHLDPDEIYFIYGNLQGDETEETKMRAFDYILKHKPSEISRN